MYDTDCFEQSNHPQCLLKLVWSVSKKALYTISADTWVKYYDRVLFIFIGEAIVGNDEEKHLFSMTAADNVKDRKQTPFAMSADANLINAKSTLNQECRIKCKSGKENVAK